MPNTRSAKKRARQNEVLRMRNRSQKSRVKSQIRKFLDAVQDKDVEQAKEEFRWASKILDQTAAKGMFHKNTTARKKSRLAARLNALVSSAG